MSLLSERGLYLKYPSLAPSYASTSSHTHESSPRRPQRDLIHPQPAQSLPPLRAFLRDEGINADIDARHPQFVGTAHEAAREEARRRALKAAATRLYNRSSPSHEYQQPTHPFGGVRMSGCHRRNLDHGNPPYPQKIVRRLVSPPCTIKDSRYTLRTISSPRPSGSRAGTPEKKSREVESFRPPPSPSARNEITSLVSSRKRSRPVDFEQSDDEDSEGDSISHSHFSNVPETKRDRLTVQAESNDVDMTNSPFGTATIEKDEGSSPRTSSRSSGGLRAGQNLEREYFSPSGIKLEVIELPVKYDTKEWLKHVEQCPEGSKTPWRCTWQTMKNGTPMPCDYSSKKHLVKRHIEATHLCIKRFQCTWCEKTFTQRSNVAGCHLNTHTGASPHGCDFCGEHFKDPSKRHKHMLRNHGYRPGESRKKFKSDESVQGQSVHESLEPWKVADE
ncbi:hypothetical protein EDB86DRAFT_4933 [Lactarius hatsudake]|nr:hypothetical protein EDB86DRAFT_4933 [Lactarius hatsudake]